MIDNVRGDLEVYKKTLTEKINFLHQLKNTISKTEVEVNILNGAIQACEKIIAENNGTIGKTE
jgi:hypothetical protein